MVRRCGSLVLSLRGMHKLMVRITIHVHVYHNMHYINIYYVRAQCHDIVSLGLLILISIITERTRPGCTCTCNCWARARGPVRALVASAQWRARKAYRYRCLSVVISGHHGHHIH